MDRNDPKNARLVALFLLGCLLILPPVLLLFNHPSRVLGVPLLYLFVFLAWAALIGLAALASRSIGQTDPADPAGDERPVTQRTRDA
ncbi:MAG TPA: hypothetical protein VFV47_10250 [Hyphomicrobiaceae bacterium]|nr:hypothetical protein [Hyphomicrobiaceae bacterium]